MKPVRAVFSVVVVFCVVCLAWALRCTNPTGQARTISAIRIVGDTICEVADTSCFAAFWAGAKSDSLRWLLVSDSVLLDTVTSSFSLCNIWSSEDSGSFVLIAEARFEDGSFVDSIEIRVQASRPIVSIRSDTVVIGGDTLQAFAEVPSSYKPITRYLWANDSIPFDSTTVPECGFHWAVEDTGLHRIILQGRDTRGILSFPDTQQVRVVTCRPEIRLSGDTVVEAGENGIYRIGIERECGGITRFVWRSGSFEDTTVTSERSLSWALSDTGQRTVRVYAVSSRGVSSLVDSILVNVWYRRPEIELMGKTHYYIRDSLNVSVVVHDSTEPVVTYLWSLDTESFDYQTTRPDLELVWPFDAVGEHVLRVKGVDERGVVSNVDSMVLQVRNGTPQAAFLSNDTLLSVFDTLTLRLSASDSNGAIQKYLWSRGGFGWQDSSKDSTLRVWYDGKDTVMVIGGARDDDGLLGMDSLWVMFNLPPDTPLLIVPGSGDSIVLSTAEGTLQSRTKEFVFRLSDPNGWSDSLRCFFHAQKDGGIGRVDYEGTDTSIVVTNLDTGAYNWRLSAYDLLGDSAVSQGSFTVIAKTAICFIGHSIVAGVGGESGKGGFRKEILSELRATSGEYSVIDPVGTLQTGILTPDIDDSCMALGGATAGQINTLLSTSEGVVPDTWVLMLGVNAYYTQLAQQLSLLGQMHARNGNSQIFVVNGIPYRDVYPWYYYHDDQAAFNESLADSVAYRSDSLNWNIEYIDAYTAFMDESVRNEALFADDLHPNQTGYDTLATLILRAIKP